MHANEFLKQIIHLIKLTTVISKKVINTLKTIQLYKCKVYGMILGVTHWSDLIRYSEMFFLLQNSALEAQLAYKIPTLHYKIHCT